VADRIANLNKGPGSRTPSLARIKHSRQLLGAAEKRATYLFSDYVAQALPIAGLLATLKIYIEANDD
jgi:hypothetical protein